MQLNEVLAVKEKILAPKKKAEILGFDAVLDMPRCAVGVGLTDSDADYTLAVRVPNEIDEEYFRRRYADVIRNVPLDVAIVGDVRVQLPGGLAANGPAQPLQIGTPICHQDGPLGTLGFFATRKGSVGLVSCNHVIALSNHFNLNDGIFDAGLNLIGKLSFVCMLNTLMCTKADCAFATIDANVPSPGFLKGEAGQLQAAPPTPLRKRTPVRKIGFATQKTNGRIRAFNVDHFDVNYVLNTFDVRIRFNDVIEIEGEFDVATNQIKPFALSGDSGALAYTRDDLRPVGLVFVDVRGKDGRERTYANPIGLVESALGVTIKV